MLASIYFSIEPAESKHFAFSDLLDGITVTVMEGADSPSWLPYSTDSCILDLSIEQAVGTLQKG